tara:strand:+ start:645 stop:1112 length:468 start_codon:yes stop_codon:yes gene_type:complete
MKNILLLLFLIIVIMLGLMLFYRKTEGFKVTTIPRSWRKLTHKNLKDRYHDLKGIIDSKIKTSEAAERRVSKFTDIKYKTNSLTKIKEKKLNLNRLLLELTKWNIEFTSKDRKTGRIKEINMKIQKLEKLKTYIRNDLEIKTKLYKLSNEISRLP